MIDLDIQNALKQLKSRSVDTFPATVVSVDKTEGTCTVDDGNIEYSDVRLSASIEESGKRFYLFPKVGSSVLISPIMENLETLYVEYFSEVDELSLETENTELKINNDGFLLKKENETLKKLMADFIKACRNMKFQTNTGVTIQLLTDPEFQALETRFNNFLK
ncbi:MAG TPA: hypothetical protein DCQ50_14770 [Chryseobacterium sp.]|nr:hypothetical protein [Chryseobacterium sp.]